MISIRAQADKALKAWIDAQPKRFVAVVSAAAQSIAFAAEERAKANAPIDTGDLRASSTTTRPTSSGGSIQIEIQFTEPYALRMHEQLTPVGPLQLGKISRQQPLTREGGVGGRYLSRAIEKNVKVWEKILSDTVQQNMGKFTKKIKVKSLPITS